MTTKSDLSSTGITNKDCDKDKLNSVKVKSAFVNKFANDGSFLEMFKKMQQQPNQQDQQQSPIKKNQKQYNHKNNGNDNDVKDDYIYNPDGEVSPDLVNKDDKSDSNDSNDSSKGNKQDKLSTKVILGKRRNQKPLKVGIIKRERRNLDSEKDTNLDAWSKYMKEVREYKEKYGDDSDKNRPLVK